MPTPPPMPPDPRCTCQPRDLRIAPGRLESLFGLTAAEARAAAALCEGLEPAAIAQQAGVQPNTVNAHLKRALAKTGTRRQAALVALLLRSAAAEFEWHGDGR